MAMFQQNFTEKTSKSVVPASGGSQNNMGDDAATRLRVGVVWALPPSAASASISTQSAEETAVRSELLRVRVVVCAKKNRACGATLEIGCSQSR